MLTIEDARVSFGATVAVDDVSLNLAAGEVLAVLGPSGCGKSTLLRAAAGLEVLDSGRVLFDGADLAPVAAHRRGFALMFQDGQLFPHLDVARNVAYPLRLRRTSASDRRERVSGLLDLVGLQGYEARSPATLSGGEQQRVALARALAAEPRLLLLDEPLSALDRSLRERLAVDLREILTSTETTALLVTHDHDEAFTIADRMAVMFSGRVVQQGRTAEVWRDPGGVDVATFLGYRTVLRGLAAHRFAHLVGLSVGGDSGAIALRRSALRVQTDGPIEGRVRSAAAVTDAVRITVEIDGLDAPVEALADQSATVEPGQSVRLRADTSQIATGLPDQAA